MYNATTKGLKALSFTVLLNLMRILYGGSVKSSNVAEIMKKSDVDGALIGGASLDPEELAKIVKFHAQAE